MNGTHRLLAVCVPAAFPFGFVASVARCGDGDAQVDGTARAKSLLVLKVTFYAEVELGDVSMEISLDGERFSTALLGLPRPDRLFKSISRGATGTTVMVPAVAGFAVGDPQFFIQEAGTYWVKWGATSSSEGGERQLEVRQAIRAQQASPSDVAFLARISEPVFLRHLFGEDFFDRQTDAVRERMLSPEGADFRALKVIGQLLKGTRGDAADSAVRERWGKGKESVETWAGAMWALAQEFPDSSYAPYAAYYAGCAYVTLLGDEIREKHGIWTWFSPEARKSRMYERREKALQFAAEHGDSYLQPRAICMQTFPRRRAGAFDEAEAFLAKAAGMAGEAGTIHDLVEKMRRDIAGAKERQLREQHGQGGN